MNWRKAALSIGLICIVLLFGSVGSASNEMETITAGTPLPMPRVVKERPLHVGYIGPELTAESCQRNWHQTQIEIEHRKWKLSSEPTASGVPVQRNALQTLIQKNVDAIVLQYVEMEPLRDLILEARKRGIGVYCIDTELRPGVLINVTIPNGVAGAMMGQFVIDRLEGKGNVAILNQTNHILRQRCYVARALFTSKVDWPNLNLVGFEDLPSNGWEKAAFDFTTAWLQKYGDKLDAIFAGFDTPGVFAARAVEAAGFTNEQVFVTGVDGGSEAYDMIRKGSPFIATISQPFELYTHTVFEIINEVQVKGIAPGAKGSSIPKTRTIYCDAVVTTEENLPAIGSIIHEVFRATYYDPAKKNEWYFWGKPYVVTSAAQ